MRQLVYTMFITNNHASFHLRWKENLVKYQKASKYYVHDCTSGKTFDNIRPIFGEVRTKKLPKKGRFVDAESVRKTLKSFNLATTNTILMKLTRLCIFMSVNWDYIKNRHICHALLCVASLVKCLDKLDHFWRIIPWKTNQSRFKMIATLTFEGL